MRNSRRFLGLAASASFVFAACSSGGASTAPSAAASEAAPSEAAPSAAPSQAAAPDAVRLQLQWAPQAQFAGYFAAVEQGYYEANGIKLTIVPGGPDVVPQQAGSAADGPEFTISWVPKVLEARVGNPASDLVDIAQVFQRSGTLSVSWKASNITKPADFKGKKVGVWDFGNEFEVTAGALKAGLKQGTDYEKVIQPFDMTLLLSKQIDVAEAMIYNEYAQVLEATNPETGALYSPDDLNIINWNDYRVAMLQDAIFARKSWLDKEGNRDIAVRFVRASLKGWIYCRDHADDCVKYTTDAGSQLGTGHQTWMLNEVNALVWPSPLGVGVLDPVFWSQTVKVSKGAAVIKNDPSIDAYDATIAADALKSITDADTKGESFKKGTVTVTPGGN
jgi:NitT/TauT family transport system substrate-binding protein